MVPVSRRRFVAAGSLFALAGCLSRDGESGEGETDDGESDEPDDDVASSLWAALDPLPRTVEDDEVQLLQAAIPRSDDEEDAGTAPTMAPSPFDLESETLDRTGTVTFRDSLRDSVASAVGSFDADDVGNPDDAAVHAEDGLALAASSDSEPWTEGLDAARAAREDPEVGVVAERPIETVLEPVADREGILCLPSVTQEDAPEDTDVDADDLASLALGLETDIDAREQHATFVVLFAEGVDPDEETVAEVFEGGSRDWEDAEIEIDGRLATATVTEELSPHQLPDDSPDAWFRIRYDGESGVAVLELTGEEAVDASNLELRVDGEVVDPPWDGDAELEPGASFEADVDPFSYVEVRWIDPEREDVHQPLGGTVVGGRDAFEGSYDLDARTLTITYTGDGTVDAGRFELQRISQDHETQETEPLTERVDALEPGEGIVVEDVSVGDQVALRVTVEQDDSEHTRSVFWHRARPPGHFRIVHEDGTLAVVYHGETEQPAAAYRVAVNDEPADTQLADVHETLSEGDRLEVEAEAGDEVAVEYVGGDEPHELRHHVVRPEVDLEFDRVEGGVEITHAEGESVAADELVVLVRPSDDPERPDAWADEYDVVEEGDSIVVELAPDEDDEDPPELELAAVLYDEHPLDYRDFEREEQSDEESSN